MKTICFDLPDNVRPKYTEIAVAMATMAGQSFEEIWMDLPVDPLAGALIEHWTTDPKLRILEKLYEGRISRSCAEDHEFRKYAAPDTSECSGRDTGMPDESESKETQVPGRKRLME